MSFIISGTTVRSFADYQDVVDRDQRLFESNEGLSETVVEDALIRASERLLTRIRSTNWWKDYQFKHDAILTTENGKVMPIEYADEVVTSDLTEI